MKLMKTVLSGMLVTAMLTGIAFADQIGVVDMQQISEKYSKAQQLAQQVKSKEEELQKLRTDLQGQLKAGEKLSPVEKKTLEEKLNSQFAAKFKEYREWTLTQEQGIKSDFDKVIQSVTQAQKLDLVLPKQTVLQGGKDITADVIKALNGN
jgi:outer membrane protein